MNLLRRVLAVAAIVLCLMAQSLPDESNKKHILEQTLSYWQQGNLEGIVSIIQNDFEGALLAIGEAPTVARDNTSTDEEIKSVVFAANILARVGAMTAESGGEGFYHLLYRNFILMDASAWKGTPLEGPGPEFDSQHSGEMIAFYDRLGAYSQMTLFSRLVKQTAILSFPSSPELERYKTGLEITRHFGDSHLGLLTQAREELELILNRGSNDPTTQYGIRFCLALIGRQTGDQELVSKSLEALAALAQNHQVFHSKTEQSLAGFSLATFKYEAEFSQRPEPLGNFLGSHAAVWNFLNESVPPERETLGAIGFLPVIMASEYWATEVTRRYCDPNLTEEEKSYLSDALMHEGMVLAKWRDPDLTTTHTTEELRNLNWEAMCGFPYWNLAVSKEARRQGNLQLAEFMLKGAESECNNVGGMFIRTLEEYPQIIPEATMQARVVGDVESEWGRLFLAQYRDSGDKTKLQQAYKKLQAAQLQENVTQNVTGILELTPDLLDALILLKPTNWYPEALKIVEDAGNLGKFAGYRPATVVHHHYLSILKESKDDLPGAVVESQTAVKLLEQLVAQYGGLTPQGLRLKELSPKVYDNATRLLAKSGDAQQAIVTIDRSQQLLSLGQLEPKSGQDSPIASNLKKIRQIRAEITALESTLGSRPDSPDTADDKAKLENAQSRFSKEITQIRAQHPEYERLLSVRPIEFGKLQKSVPADTAVVQYFPSDDRLYLFVLTSDALQVRQAEIGREALKNKTFEFRKSITTLTMKDELSQSLYKMLIGPVEAEIAGKKVVVLVPTGTLAYLPFAALKKGDSYLVESHQLAIVQQSSQLENLTKPASSGEGDMIVVGNPDETLPSAELEAEAVVGFFAKAKLLLRGQATLASLIESLKSPVSYLHMATHGVLDSTDPTASYIVLAGSRLHNYEIAAMKLNGTRLVTLSACQTALGSQEPGSEVASLAQAFGFAGAPCVVATLWSIDDQQTKKLMSEFYGRLKAGDSVAEAMNYSQLALLKSPQSAAPFYWAGFQVGGDWR